MKDNAAVRFNYVSELYECGVIKEKKKILSEIEDDFFRLHNEGVLHIHDLEAYGKVYNCCIPNSSIFFKSGKYNSISQTGKIFELFENIKDLIVELATNQSGGIAFANFDEEIAAGLEMLNVDFTTENIMIFKDCVSNFIKWINTIYTRYCREPYYLTLNIGLAHTDWGKKTSEILLILFKNAPVEYKRPNIVFKVNKNVNGEGTDNYEIYKLALTCTAERMIPTYLLTNSSTNELCDPRKMGCRTRVYDNVNGVEGSIGRGNIACVSINLPRIALEETNLGCFYDKLDNVVDNAVSILRHRAKKFVEHGNEYLKFVLDNQLWETQDISELARQGTLSVGFIGLSECVEILTGSKPYQCTNNSNDVSIEIVKRIRNRIDQYKKETELNFSVLASPGEMLSSKFCKIDSERYPNHTG